MNGDWQRDCNSALVSLFETDHVAENIVVPNGLNGTFVISRIRNHDILLASFTKKHQGINGINKDK